MNQNTVKILFALLRSAICGNALLESEKELLSDDVILELYAISKKHDIAHLLAIGLEKNGLLEGVNKNIENEITMAKYRYTQQNYEYKIVCEAFENAQIPFIPLKGSVLRRWYPEPWMRTSCDIDILVHREDLEKAITYLTDTLKYTETGRATHDVSLFSQSGIHIELHFDLVEEGRANNAIDVLNSVWENALLKSGNKYWYELAYDFFFFYHIAHMAKHFEVGGCGIRPFIDLWILDTQIEEIDKHKRESLLEKCGLLKFASVAQNLSKCWFDGLAFDELTLKLQSYILVGGVYGSAQNRVALQQTKKGGKLGYILSRMFIPYDKLKRYYPILEKHRWLMPFMQIRRWGMLLKPSVAKMAKAEVSANKSINKATADEMNGFLNELGL